MHKKDAQHSQSKTLYTKKFNQPSPTPPVSTIVDDLRDPTRRCDIISMFSVQDPCFVSCCEYNGSATMLLRRSSAFICCVRVCRLLLCQLHCVHPFVVETFNTSYLKRTVPRRTHVMPNPLIPSSCAVPWLKPAVFMLNDVVLQVVHVYLGTL